MTIELGILISGISVAFAIFFGMSNNRRAVTDDIEKRTIEHTKVEMKLDEIGRNVADIKYDISATKKEVNGLAERVLILENSHHNEKKRVDHIVDLLEQKEESE